MIIYGIRQKEILTITFGILLGYVVPMAVGSGWGVAACSIGVGVLYWVIRKYR